MLGVMARQLSHPNVAKRRASEKPGMELRLESRALHEAIEATSQFFKTQRVIAFLVIACSVITVVIALRWPTLNP